MKAVVQKLKHLRIKNFKAIRDSKKIPLSPFTVIIGDNGSGKSSLIDAIETYRMIVMEDLGKGIRLHGAFDDIWNKSVPHKLGRSAISIRNDKEPYQSNPMEFDFWCNFEDGGMHSGLSVSSTASKTISIVSEEIKSKSFHYDKWNLRFSITDRENNGDQNHPFPAFDPLLNKSIISLINNPRIFSLKKYIERWQFLSLDARRMGLPGSQVLTGGELSLEKDGGNISEFLYELFESDLESYNDLVDSLQWVLPYLKDLQPVISTSTNQIYFKMGEGGFEIPSWVLSTGTLRILAFLALLRSPNPPPLIVIDEIENGLDPRTLLMLLREIESSTESGRTQVIATTHSPYLLDQLPLSSVIVAERKNDGKPVFWKPSQSKKLRSWAEKFATGELYTMDRMHITKLK